MRVFLAAHRFAEEAADVLADQAQDPKEAPIVVALIKYLLAFNSCVEGQADALIHPRLPNSTLAQCLRQLIQCEGHAAGEIVQFYTTTEFHALMDAGPMDSAAVLVKLLALAALAKRALGPQGLDIRDEVLGAVGATLADADELEEIKAELRQLRASAGS